MSAGTGVELTVDALRHAFGMFPSGVTAVCALIDDRPVGMAASSFTSVSLDPPLVSVCMAHTSSTWPVLKRSARLGVSVLASNHSMVARALSAKNGDRFADVSWEVSDTGAILLHGSALWLECIIEHEFRAGDHDIVVFRVTSLQPYPDVAPMVFHGSAFRQLVLDR